MLPSPRLRAVIAFAVVGLGASGVALGLPWDTDMSDGQQRKGYSFEMKALPDGVVSQPSLTSPKPFVPNFVRGSAEGEALVNPRQADENAVADGKKMFGVYCTPCHGDGVVLGPVAQPGRMAGVAVLAGPAGVARTFSDGYIYLTVRNGGKLMPAYAWAMSDAEMWSVVSYVRTLDNAARATPSNVPAPAPAEAP